MKTKIEWVKNPDGTQGYTRKDIFAMVGQFPQHTHIFLTKRPENLIKWSPLPDNCWVGLSVDGTENAPLLRVYNGLAKTQAKVKFISFEPLLADPKLDSRDLEWAGIGLVIIGQQTPIKKATKPKIEWIAEIVEACDKAGIAVFLKNNLRDVFVQEAIKQDPIPDHCYPTWARDKVTGYLRQELPQ